MLRYNYLTEEEFLNRILSSSVLSPCLRLTAEEEPAVSEQPVPAPADERRTAFPAGQKSSAPETKQAAAAPEKKASGSRKKILIWSAVGAAVLFAAVMIISSILGKNNRIDPDDSSAAAGTSTASVVQNESTAAPVTDAAPQNQTAASEAETTDTPTEAPTEAPEEQPFRGELEKVMSVTIGSNQISMVHGSGLIYGDYGTALLGLRTYDGVTDTGLLYSMNYSYLYGQYEKYEGKYLVVTSDTGKPEKSAASLNRLGIMDSRGNVIVPEGYAYIKDANEYYAVCVRVSEETAKPEEAVITWSAKDFSSDAGSGDRVYFKGEWELVSLETGKPVPGFAGTKQSEYDKWKYGSSLYGNLIEVQYNKKYCRADGSELEAGAEVLYDGSYIVREPSKGTVYDTNGKELFTFDPNEGSNALGDGLSGYFAVRGLPEGKGYTLLDQNGQAISVEYVSKRGDEPKVCGPFVIVPGEDSSLAGQVYDLQGNLITEKPVSLTYAEYDELHRVLYLETQGMEQEYYLFVSEEGEILLDIAQSEVKASAFLVRQGEKYYNFATKAFDLSGETLYCDWWISVRNAGGKYDLVDTFTGEVLLRGYDDYSVVTSPDYGTIVGAVYNQTTDVFILR